MECIVAHELVAHELVAHELVAHELVTHKFFAHELGAYKTFCARSISPPVVLLLKAQKINVTKASDRDPHCRRRK